MTIAKTQYIAIFAQPIRANEYEENVSEPAGNHHSAKGRTANSYRLSLARQCPSS